MKRLWAELKRLSADERGAEGLEKLLIIAAVVLPLLGLLIIFRNEIKTWVVDIWKRVNDLSRENEDQYFSNQLNGS